MDNEEDKIKRIVCRIIKTKYTKEKNKIIIEAQDTIDDNIHNIWYKCHNTEQYNNLILDILPYYKDKYTDISYNIEDNEIIKIGECVDENNYECICNIL